jgi:hypothetical protein
MILKRGPTGAKKGDASWTWNGALERATYSAVLLAFFWLPLQGRCYLPRSFRANITQFDSSSHVALLITVFLSFSFFVAFKGKSFGQY